MELFSCNSGEEATVEHVSWRCLHFQDIRQPMIDAVEDRVHQLPVITQYAGIVLNNSTLTQDQVTLMQSTLVNLAEKHTKHNMQKISKIIHQITQINLPTDFSHLTQTVTPSSSKKVEVCVCQKCGKYVQNLGHIKLKITKKPCEFAHVQPQDYITEPGQAKNPHRLDCAFQELNQTYNHCNHDLVWNYKIGKKPGPEEGLLSCKACGRTWTWKDRANNLSRTICSKKPDCCQRQRSLSISRGSRNAQAKTS